MLSFIGTDILSLDQLKDLVAPLVLFKLEKNKALSTDKRKSSFAIYLHKNTVNILTFIKFSTNKVYGLGKMN